MKINMTNESLLAIDMEVVQWQGSALMFFLNGKIQKFYQDNGIRLNTLKEKRKELLEEFVVMENGQVKLEEVEGKQKPVYKDSLREKEFQDKMQELMTKQIAIEV